MLASFKDAAGGALEALGAAQAARAGVSIVFVDQGRLSEVVRSFTSTNVLDFGINTFAGLTHTTDTLGDPVQGLRKYFGIEGFPGGLNSILPPSKGYPFAELGFSKIHLKDTFGINLMLQNKPIAANIERDGFLTGVESDIFGDGAGQEGRGRQQAAQVELSDEDVEILLATPPGNLTEDQVRLIVENSDLLRRYLERQMVDSVNHLNLIKYK